MADPKFTTGSTHTFRLEATKDEVTWDITGATVTLRLFDPSGNSADYTATLTTPTSGIADYTVATSVLDEVGNWKRQWKVVQSGVTLWSRKIDFWVEQGG